MSRKQVKGNELAEELMSGVSPALLQALHILTRDGDLNADSRRKLKQVKHLLQLLEPAVRDVLGRFEAPLVVDCGAGKGYLGFLLAQTQLQPAGRGSVLNIEARQDLVDRASAIASEAGLAAFVRFLAAPVAHAELGGAHPHLVVALHACDTATDDALRMGLSAEAEWIAVVPCCQAEVAQLLKQAGRSGAFTELYSAPDPSARVRCAPDQRGSRARPRSGRLPSDGDGAGRLGALAQERAHLGPQGPTLQPHGQGQARRAPRTPASVPRL